MKAKKEMRLSLTLAALLFTTCCLAQSNIEVSVTNRDNGEAVPFAYISSFSIAPRQLQVATQTDEDGKVTLLIPSFPAEIEVTALGYDPEKLKLVNGSEASLKIALTKRFGTLNEVVVTGVSQPSKPEDAASIYKVITAATIRAQGAVTLNEVLSNQVNISVKEDAVLGSSLTMQSMGGDKVKILMDGMPLNGREGGNIDLSQINLSNVQRIEVVQGPMSVVYGADALGGVINLISRDIIKNKSLEATGYYESIGKYNVSVLGSHKWKRHQFTLSGGRNFFQGWDFIDSLEPHRKLRFKPKEQYFGNFSYGYNAASGFKLRFYSDLLQEKVTNKGEASISPWRAYAFDEYYHNTRLIERLTLDGKAGAGGHWQMMNGYSYYHRVRSRYSRDLVEMSQQLTDATGDQDTATFHEANFRGTYNNKWSRLNYTLGYDVDVQTGMSQKIPRGVRYMNDYAAFIMLKHPVLTEKLSASAGVRLGKNTVYKTPVIPSFNLLYLPNTRTTVRASYAKGYRAPSLKELYLDFVDQNHDVHGNEQLHPEYADHVQVSGSLKVFEKNTDYLQFLLTGYYNNVYDAIALAKVNPALANDLKYAYVNIDHQQNAIATAELEGQQGNLHYKLAYSFTYFFKQPLFDAFHKHEVVSNVQYYWKQPKISLSVFHKFSGVQPFLAATIDGGAAFNGKLPAYDMMDVSVQRKFLSNKLELTVGVKNVFDIRNLSATGVVASGAHGGDGNTSFLPRRLFTSLRVLLD